MVDRIEISDHLFRKRVKPKRNLRPTELGKLKLERKAVVYKRLSTYEQLQNSRFSLERWRLQRRTVFWRRYKRKSTVATYDPIRIVQAK